MTRATTFEIIPAIDLRGGQVVRLRQGDFGRETVYSDDPVAVARRFADAGARWLHVVDLDGARTGEAINGSAVREIVAAVRERMQVEVAGGLRTPATVRACLDAGAARAVIGTAAVHDPGSMADLVAMHGSERIAVALDVRDGLAVGDGWVPGAPGIPVDAALQALTALGVATFEVTAIDRDGGMEGPDLPLYRRLVDLGGGTITASGGIRSIHDLRVVRDAGCVGAIVGSAFLDGSLDLVEAVAALGPG